MYGKHDCLLWKHVFLLWKHDLLLWKHDFLFQKHNFLLWKHYFLLWEHDFLPKWGAQMRPACLGVPGSQEVHVGYILYPIGALICLN